MPTWQQSKRGRLPAGRRTISRSLAVSVEHACVPDQAVGLADMTAHVVEPEVFALLSARSDSNSLSSSPRHPAANLLSWRPSTSWLPLAALFGALCTLALFCARGTNFGESAGEVCPHVEAQRTGRAFGASTAYCWYCPSESGPPCRRRPSGGRLQVGALLQANAVLCALMQVWRHGRG